MLEQAASVPGLRVRAAWDIDPQACRLAQADFPGTVIAADPQTLVSRSDVDVVYVGTPPAFHRPYALMAAAQGRRVFCEKPLTSSLDDAHRLVAELAELGTPNAVNFVYASAPSADYLQRRLIEGSLGAIQGIDMRVFFSQWPREWQASAQWLRAREQGGFVREVLSHFVYLSIRLFGDCRLIAPRCPGRPTPHCERPPAPRSSARASPYMSASAVAPAGRVSIRPRHFAALRLSYWYEVSESDGRPGVRSVPLTRSACGGLPGAVANLERFGRGLSHLLPDAALALRANDHRRHPFGALTHRGSAFIALSSGEMRGFERRPAPDSVSAVAVPHGRFPCFDTPCIPYR
jgi:hypothetical protein